MTPAKKAGISAGETTVVCLDCGAQLAYDWNHMRIARPVRPKRSGTAAANSVSESVRPVDRSAAVLPVRQLVAYIESSGRGYIIAGEVDCALADHPRPHSLDYWLRENFAQNKDAKQATGRVIDQLIVTGFFEKAAGLRCPDTGERSQGLRLKHAVAG